LAWHAFDDGDDMAGILRLDFISNPEKELV